jgi:hypothetical protein
MDNEQERPGDRSVTVRGDVTDSVIATGDHTTIVENPTIILPSRPLDQIDHASSPHRSRTDLLDELTSRSRGRMIARWLAVGISAELARELADDPTVGALSSELSSVPEGTVRVLEGHLGIGKSLLGERLHQHQIQQARLHVDAPVPVWLQARDLRGDLATTVIALGRGLGDPHRTGAAVVIDGLDEDGSRIAADLIEQARVLVHSWPMTGVLLTTRPGPAINDDERVAAPLLSDDQADALVQRIAADGESFDHWLWRWPEEARAALRETLRTPLFASIMGTLRREGQAAPLSPAELVEHLVDRGLHIASRGASTHTEHTIRSLLCRVAVATTQRGGRLPLVEVGSHADQAAVLASRLVAQQGATLAFPLPLLEQWFAAQALLDGLVDFLPLVEDLRQLEPWRWPLVMATRVGSHQPVTHLLEPLAVRHPGLAGWIIHQAEENRWRHQPPAAPPPARESGQRVRSAMQAWVTGLGPLAPDLAPVRADGRLQPTGVRVDGTHVTTAWYRGYDELAVIADLPREIPWRAVRHNWWLIRSGSPGSASTWAWPWTMGSLRTVLEKRLRRRALRPRPGGVLEREARWRLCNGILGRGRLTVRPVEVREVLAAIHDKLARVPQDAVSVRFGFTGLGALSDRELRQLAADLEQSGLTSIEAPWEPPDLPRGVGGGRWVWSDYSPAALLRRTQQVYRGALEAYTELVDQYFPTWRPTLSMAAWMPLCLQGTLEPATGDAYDDAPGLTWSVVPLEPGSANRIKIELGEPKRIWPDWDAFSAWNRSRHEALQRWRPEVLPYVRFVQEEGILEIFGSRPATLLAYEWLSEDLHHLGWLKARISHHVSA